MIAQLDKRYLKTRPGRAVARLVSYLAFEGRPLTTKGRWINPFVFLGFHILKLLPQLKRVDRPIFMLGTGRSGSTILGKLFSYHRQVGWLNEPKALWHSFYDAEDVIGNYTLKEAHYGMDETLATPGVVRKAKKLYGGYLALTGNRRALDKSDNLVFRSRFIKALFPDAKFIFLVRSGVDTTFSVKTWSEKHGANTDDWWGRNDRKWQYLVDQVLAPDPYFQNVAAKLPTMDSQVDRAALEWIATMRAGHQVMQQYPEDTFLIKYEDLLADPKGKLGELVDQCGLPADSGLLDYAADILKPVPEKPPFTLDMDVQPLFQETMDLMGYGAVREQT